MLVLLGVPWIFSAFGVISTAGDKDLEMLQGIFNVSNRYYMYDTRYIGSNAVNQPAKSNGIISLCFPKLSTLYRVGQKK